MSEASNVPSSVTCISCMAMPHNEDVRLKALRNLHILDTPPEDRFDRIVRLAARVFDVPISYISMVDANRQWFKSRHGVEATETPRDISFCGHAILQNDPFVVSDLTLDERFAASPLVTGTPFARFYAGMPLAVGEGVNVGTLCVLDTKPRELTYSQVNILRDLGRLVEHEFQLLDTIELQQQSLRLQEDLIESQRNLAEEKERSDALLRNILPDDVAAELKKFGRVRARHKQDVNVMLTDFSGFTAVSESMEAAELLEELNVCFMEFDQITMRLRVEKLKTIGDAYMCVSGLNDETEDSALRLLRAAAEMQVFVRERKMRKEMRGRAYWDIRIGLHSGPLVAGVVGNRKFAFDVWGDTVNTAARFESASEPGRINISRPFLEKVRHHIQFTERGLIPIKGKTEMEMFFVDTVR